MLETSTEHQRAVTTALANDVKALRDGLGRRLDELAAEHAQRVTELAAAQRANHAGTVAAVSVVLSEIEHQQHKLELEQANVLKSRDAVAD